jgi:hypothetical protein
MHSAKVSIAFSPPNLMYSWSFGFDSNWKETREGQLLLVVDTDLDDELALERSESIKKGKNE